MGFDNEPRNREIVERINKAINRGDKVVIWPNNIVQKDINDMVLSGHHVQDIVESNTFQGLQAKLNLQTGKGMTNGNKVKKRNGTIEPLNLRKDPCHG